MGAQVERVDESLDMRRHESGTIALVRPRASQAPLPAQARVLVVGIVPSLTWAVARSLMLAGHRPVVLGAHALSPMQMFPGLLYLAWRNVRFFDDDLDPLLVDQIEDVCREHAIDCVLPVDYPSVVLLSDSGQALKSARLVDLPRTDLMRGLYDKWELANALMRLGLPQPRTELALDASRLAATQLPFPIVTKPVQRWGAQRVQLHRSREQLEQRIVEASLAADYPLVVQEYIPGQDVGFAFVARDGELVAHAAFEQPVRGSRRYFDAPRLRQYVALLLRETGYHGLGEIATRYDPTTDEYRLLEVKPHFGASTLYAARAGLNFPEWLMRLGELPAGLGFSGQIVPVRLSLYERAAAHSIRLAEQAHYSMRHPQHR